MNKPGRNDPCHCGSGKKYKHCCGSMQDNGPPVKMMPSSGGSLQELLQTGLGHHQAGHLPQAEAIYRQILQAAPNHPDALYLSGLAAHEAGRSEAAVGLIERAIRINPISPFYYSLGNVFHKLGRLDEAAVSFRKALKLTPDAVDVHLNLGNTLKTQDKPDEAVEHLRRALKLQPGLVDAHLVLGNMLKEQGKLDEAVESIRKALLLKPDYAEAHNNLGNVLKEQGKLDEATESFHEALKLKPGYAEAYSNLGEALRDQGKLDEAIESFHKALEFKPNLAEAWNSLGSALHDQGKLDEAIESFREALKLKPDYAGAGNGLGNVFKEQNKLDAAIGCYRKVLEFSPDMAGVHSNLGGALREQGEQEAAAESFRKVLALEPDYIDAHIGLGAVCQDTGRFADAQTHLDRVLELKPEHPAAWAALPALRKMTPDDLPWAETAQRLLANDPKPQEEVGLCYALGKYYDDTRQYDAAFGYYARANRLKGKRAGLFDRDKFRRFVDTAISMHPVEVVRHRQAGSSDSSRPLFIVGMPRSGTSLTEQILASHSDVFGAGELRFWGKQAQEHGEALASGYHDAALLGDIASRCETELQRHSASALRVVDKMPGNFLYLGLIHAVFPQARILHTQRNPIDTCLSIYFQAFNNSHTYATDLDDLAFYYREYRRLMAHWRAVLPPEVFLDVPYEALVEDQEGWSRRIIEFIGLEWDERCLNFHETERKVGTASNWQVRQKIYKTSKERWRNYEQFVGPLLPLLEQA